MARYPGWPKLLNHALAKSVGPQKQNWNRMTRRAEESTPILVVPYMWIGDFVRCHSVVQVLKARWPRRPVDVLSAQLTAPLLDYMPDVRKGIVWDLPRKSLALASHYQLAQRLRDEEYGAALVMPRTWKSALAPFLAGILQRTGYAGEARFVLLNDLRWGERKIERMVDQCAALALPKSAPLPPAWPMPRLAVPAAEIPPWRSRRGLDGHLPVVALAPGSMAVSRRWPIEKYGALARELTSQGVAVWILGGPNEKDLASQIVAASEGRARDVTGNDLREAVLALAAADVAVCNDSGLLHVAAATGTHTIGIFGPTSAWHWAPLNPLAAVIQADTQLPCRPCHQPTCRVDHHLCVRDIAVEQVKRAVARILPRLNLRIAN